MDITRRPDARAGNLAAAPRSISPTDISQFIRLEQCERYLRLRLKERAEGRDFLYAYDVAPQSIPPILTRSGASFESAVEADIAQQYPTLRFGPERRRELHLTHDNADTMEALATLGAGETVVLFQPRVEATVDGWRLRGDVDLLRAERDAADTLRLLIADMKSSTASRVEHRLQVAFYHEMLATLLAEAGIAHAPIELAILYRGPVRESLLAPVEDREDQERQRQDAEQTLGTSAGLLDRVRDVDAYLGSVRDLVTKPESTAHHVLGTDFEEIPFHLTWKCDGCLYNEFCMKRSAETDNLSLLPHITEQDKRALEDNGIATTRQLASLKSLVKPGEMGPDGKVHERTILVPSPGHSDTCERLAATWPVGPRLDELIHRALRYEHWKTKQGTALSYIPNRGYGSMPHSDAEQNPNLVRIFIDAQHDYLNDRTYMLGALVVANEGGRPHPKRRRSIARLSDGPPDSDEREESLFVDWITETLRTIVELAAPNIEGEAKAPIHLTFVNGFAQRVLLDGLARHKDSILGATALYDFVTQLAAFDSAIASYLETEIREHRNYPMVCQSLQAVAAYLKFDWNAGAPYREIFRTRMFDFWGRFEAPPDGAEEIPGKDGWFTSRARFNSQIPLEYAYAAWGELPVPEEGEDDFATYRGSTPELLQRFHARRLEAMEHIVDRDLPGNRQTALREFELPDLAAFEEIARDLAHALNEFVVIERHVELAEWKRDRLAEPEQRVLSGQTLIVQYREEDQEPGMAAQNRDNVHRRAMKEEYRARYREAHPDAKQVRLPKEQRAKSDWTNEGLCFRLRITVDDVACDLDEALRLTTIREGDWLVIFPRWTFDSRLPEAERYLFTPTAKQLLYGMRCTLERIVVDRDEQGMAQWAWAEVTMNGTRGGGMAGFTFGTIGDNDRPLTHGEVLTLDPDPSNIYAAWTKQVTEGLIAGGENSLYDILAGREFPEPEWPEAARAAQQRFLDGIDALHAAAAENVYDFELSKREFIGAHGDTPVLLVQGPPGTGKSYSTAYAILARIQGAMAANREYRVFLSCKTHAATDVLLENVAEAQELLRQLRTTHSEIIGRHIDERVLDLPLYRYRSKNDVPAGVTPLPRDKARQDGQAKAVDRLLANRWAVVAATPGGIYALLGDHFGSKDRFGHPLADCLVLDEASQMSMPEAIMAALPLKPGGSVIVVGDHRQMPPIVRHDWASEPRRSFRQFRTFESLFLALLALDPPMIQFAESYRLHADMAKFLRDEIYIHDGIEYHSHKANLFSDYPTPDDFLAAVLAPEHPLTVVVHDETNSQVRNDFERRLLAPMLQTLSDPARFALDPHEGLGVVVPHRAQRAALQEDLVRLLGPHSDADEAVVSAVDTIERFQGGERDAILIGVTESDRDYILMNGEFLLDPRRLTVALSRAKQKLVLVAARSVFEVFSADEETFANAQLWKNLLRKTCTVPLWEGERCGHHVAVWGNRSSAATGR
ncbi:MAG TPA: AAA domain-containing protein [Thermomicrobiales bacterium]|nr:AAA domain-containing protein [Thermomicrobiales bacterium]